MSLDLDAVRAHLETQIITAMAAAHPNAKVNAENRPPQQDPINGWYHIAVIFGDVQRADISKNYRRFRQYGVVNVTLMVGKDRGTQLVNDMTATVLVSLLDKTWALNGGTLRTHSGERRTRGVISDTYAVNALMEFEYDFTVGGTP